jgi:hypothetical protein
MRLRRFLLAALAVLAIGVVAAPAASASDTWYWSPERAERALEIYDTQAAGDRSGASCLGTGHSIRPHGHRLYRKFNCDEFDTRGDYVGSGEIKVTGESMRRYRWLTWDNA